MFVLPQDMLFMAESSKDHYATLFGDSSALKDLSQTLEDSRLICARSEVHPVPWG